MGPEIIAALSSAPWPPRHARLPRSRAEEGGHDALFRSGAIRVFEDAEQEALRGGRLLRRRQGGPQGHVFFIRDLGAAI
jgi:hypothetical protein